MPTLALCAWRAFALSTPIAPRGFPCTGNRTPAGRTSALTEVKERLGRHYRPKMGTMMMMGSGNIVDPFPEWLGQEFGSQFCNLGAS